MGEPAVSTDADLELAKAVLRDRGASFVFAARGRVLEVGTGRGVLPLVRTVTRLGVGTLEGAALADKLVGRAAAFVAAYAKLGAVHGEFMSQGAMEELTARGIPFTYGIEVPAVLNRSGSRLCPSEELVDGAGSPDEAMARLQLAADGEAVMDVVPEAERGAPRAGEGWNFARVEPGPGPVAGRGDDLRSNRRPAGSAARRVARGGLWLALAVLLPQLAHGLALGPSLLLMHIPVLLAGALSGPGIGVIVGMLAPWISHLVTGMPPLSPPVAPLMTFELAAYGAAAGLLRGRAQGPARARAGGVPWAAEYGWLVPTLVVGRIALGVAAALLGGVLGLPVPAWVYLKGAVVTGIPGVALQLALVPVLIVRLEERFGQQ